MSEFASLPLARERSVPKSVSSIKLFLSAPCFFECFPAKGEGLERFITMLSP